MNRILTKGHLKPFFLNILNLVLRMQNSKSHEHQVHKQLVIKVRVRVIQWLDSGHRKLRDPLLFKSRVSSANHTI